MRIQTLWYHNILYCQYLVARLEETVSREALSQDAVSREPRYSARHSAQSGKRGLAPPPPQLIRHRPLSLLYQASHDETSLAGSDVTVVIVVAFHVDLVGEAEFASDLVLHVI